MYKHLLNRNVFTHIAVATVCIGVGIGLGVGWQNRSADTTDIASVPAKVVDEAAHIKLLTKPQPTQQTKDTFAIETGDAVSIENALSMDSDQNGDTQLSNFSEPADSAVFTTDLAFLDGVNIEMFNTGELDGVIENFDAWIVGNDNPGKDIFDFLASAADDEQKHVLEWLVGRSSAIGSAEGLADSVVQELAVASEADYEQWGVILSLVNIDTASARNELFNALPNITDNSVVAASLLAVQPGLVPPEERAEFLSNLSSYGESASEEVKSAAIETMGKWSAHDYTYLVEDTLANGSDKEKTSALYAVADGTLRSDNIKYQLFSILDDESTSLEMKMDAFSSVSNFSLSEQEYAEYYRFYEQYVLPQERLTTQQ